MGSARRHARVATYLSSSTESVRRRRWPQSVISGELVAGLAQRRLVGHVRRHQVCAFGMMRLVAGEASDLGCTLTQRRVRTRHRMSFNRVIGVEGLVQADVL